MCRDEKQKNEWEGREEFINAVKGVDKPHIKFVLKDYQTMNQEIRSRGSITLIVGTILITASFLILGDAAKYRYSLDLKVVMAIVSIGLYLSWFFILNYTTKKLDNMTFSRMKAIESGLTQRINIQHFNFGIHTYIEQRYHEKKWIEIRRRFWVVVMMLLFTGWGLVFIFG